MVKNSSASLLFVLVFWSQFLWAQTNPDAQYSPDLVVFKLKGEFAPGQAGARTLSYSPANEELAAELADLVGAKRAFKAIPQQIESGKNSPLSRTSEAAQALSLIYKLELTESQDVQETIQQLLSSKQVEYAEPYYLPQLLHTPDDGQVSQQKYLEVIKAFEGWEVSKGKQDVIIGIIDSGVDFDHPDLKDNLYLNLGDPIDGIDNDKDGFVDNYKGWDFANNDNDPTADKDGHGTFVTGFSSATPNNQTGIAGVGYSCRYMPIKIFKSEDNVFHNGYEAIVYAANMGCNVINLSWGAAGTHSQYVQDIINYAVLEKDAVIIAAAGNTKEELNFYPASYDNVLSVASSNLDDSKSDYCTWSRYVDIMAPGYNVYSTKNGGGYGTSIGTSFSSPQVAGAAALVRSYYPELNAQQVMERLRMSTDDVSKTGSNSNFKEKIGKGRLNIQKALAKEVSPAVRMQQYQIFNGSGPFAFYNDTLEIRMDFKNFLSPTTDLKVELTTSSPYVTILNGKIDLKAVGTLQTVKNDKTPFRVHLHSNLPDGEVITFRLGYSDINFHDYQYFELRTIGEFMDFKADDLSLTVSSNGNLGYHFNFNLNGVGLRQHSNALAHNLGLIMATSDLEVANNMVKTYNPVVRNQDFKTVNRIKLYNNSNAYRDARSIFETRNTAESPLNLLIEQKILGWKDEIVSSGIAVEYRITNRSTNLYPELFTGMFADFDIQEYFKNKSKWDAEARMGYTYSHLENRYAGIALLSTEFPQGFYAMDIASRNGNKAEYADSISRAQKFNYIAKGLAKTSAGLQGSGNDVAQFLSAKLVDFAPNESRKVAFTIVAASSLEELRKAVKLARERYQEYLASPPLRALHLVCPGTNLTLRFPEGENFNFYSDPFGKNLLGAGSSFLLENLTEDKTIYVANSSNAWLGDIEQIKVEVKPPVANFSMSADTVTIEPGETAELQLTDLSEVPSKWMWNFSNGYTSTKQSPKAFFNAPGTYTISLRISNIANCTAEMSKKVVVINRSEKPLISDQMLCNPGQATIQSEDGADINVYGDAKKQQKLFSGRVFTSQVLTKSTTFYATGGKGAYESDLLEVRVGVSSSKIEYSHEVDSTSTEKYALKLHATTAQPEKVSRIEWLVNGVLADSTSILLWPYQPDDQKIQVQAIAYYQNGCVATSEKEISFLPSDKPQLSNLSLCRGSALRLRPAKEGLYYFYADESKQNLLKKGREYTLESLSETTSYYVTNISLGKESETTVVQAIILEDLANFSPEQDTLFLGSSIQFNSLHPEAISHVWDFGNGISSTLADPKQYYTEAGTYTVSLTAENASGCTETFSRTFVITEPTGFGSGSAASDYQLKIFPNPAKELVTVELPALLSPAHLYIKDVSGRTIQREDVKAGQWAVQIDVSTFSSGWYMLQIQNEEGFFAGKLWKE